MLHAGVATPDGWRRLRTQRVQTFRKRANKSVASQLRRAGAVYAGSLPLKLSTCGNWILDTLCSLCAVCSLPLVRGSGTCIHQAPLVCLAVHHVRISSRRQSGLKAPSAFHTFEIPKPAPSFTLPAIPFHSLQPKCRSCFSRCFFFVPALLLRHHSKIILPRATKPHQLGCRLLRGGEHGIFWEVVCLPSVSAFGSHSISMSQRWMSLIGLNTSGRRSGS